MTTTTTSATTAEVVHSFLEEKPLDRDEYLNNNICVRFIRKKFKCLMIFFLALCVIGETFLVINDKINFNLIFENLVQKATHNNATFMSFMITKNITND